MGVLSDALEFPLAAGYVEGEEVDEIIQGRDGDCVWVIKSHLVSAYVLRQVRYGHVMGICTLRDPRDCVASRLLFKPDESFCDAVSIVKGSYLCPMRLGDSSVLFIDYGAIMGDPMGVIQQIMKYLGVNASYEYKWQIASAMAGELSMERMKEISDVQEPDNIDPLYQLHENHINGGVEGRALREMTETQLTYCNRKLREEIDFFHVKQSQPAPSALYA